MKHFYTCLIAILLFSGGLNAQFLVTINVIDATNGAPLENAQVVFDGNSFGTTDASGNATFPNIATGEYSYSVSMPCFSENGASVSVNNADLQTISALSPLTSNSVFFYVGSPLTIPGANILLTGDSFYQEITTGAPFGDMFENVPFGNYVYTITTPCYETISGIVIVNCTNGDGIAVFEEPVLSTTNSVFFYIGSPLSISGAIVNVSGDGFSQELVTGAPFGDVIDNLPFGNYTYSITASCYEPVSGTFMVDCNNGEGIMVSEEPAEIVINNAVTQVGSILEAVAEGYSYQWLDCNNSNLPIEGATNRLFEATSNGSYAVVISNDNCSITSTCFSIDNVGINTLRNSNKIEVFPNPFNSITQIKLPSNTGNSSIQIYSITGQLVYSNLTNSIDLIQIDLSQLKSGVYFLILSNHSGIYRAPIQKN